MKTLVLNVDRDDDFGRKAKIKSPIIGISKNLDAANKLGQTDPEDSDLNAIYYAISTYNSLINDKKDAEIATICGDINVGFKSDQILSEQLEQVIKETNVDNVILVSDGAEDEYILPMIQSRIKITSILRVSVKQSRELEDTYYRILKILGDDKVKKQFVLPLALVLIIGSVSILLDMGAIAFGLILLVLGLYLLIRVFSWERQVEITWDKIKIGFLTAKLTAYTSIIAVVILIAFGIATYNNISFKSESIALPVLSFINNMIWGIVIAGLIIVFGRVVDIYFTEKRKPWDYWTAPFSIFAFGFIIYAITRALYDAFINWPNSFSTEPFLTLSFFGFTVTGIMIAFIGTITYMYIKDIHNTENKEQKIEKPTKKLTEKN